MALIDFSSSNDLSPSLSNGAIMLRAPHLRDYEAWRELREDSRAHLTRWEPDWTAEEMTPAAFKERIKAYQQAARRGVAAPYFVFRRDDQMLVGGVTLINILRGAAQSASLGYWTGHAHARRGYARQAVEAMLERGFHGLRLNRIEAACQPENTPSQALLGRLGFHQEGYAREYLHINGAWRDHLIFAMTASQWRGEEIA